ncbi:MAG TPA: VOC family protein [Acidimicrobiales bacterium]|jgi:glyoxylase I family protein|nr:VOC family protein [Acidimicrobiales bacterium]
MPDFAKVSHLSFSARDAERSASWYQEVLGVEVLDRVAGEGWHSVLLIHPPSAAIIEFQQHDANGGETFDPRRTGLDHLGLLVSTRAELERWRDHFERLGVVHSPIADRDYGSVLCFRDPDGIQLEMFYRQGHP